ncbi:hypothetical protein HFV06_09290 [Pseudomonas fluorescens]|nr:hypothetical protein [Pseudomonas fluorescens]NKI51536.1 hypothetical protein [Pseudomonas fluorescens]NKI64029.1 hypothetical protein [Pseudomonas fluorescens]
MDNGHPPQSEQVESLLQALERDKDELLKLCMDVVGPSGSPMYPLDWMVFAAIKRTVSTSSATVAMVRAWNMVCARSLLRMHIDTALRFSAAWLVSDPHQFATNVMKGEPINKMKDRTGKRPLSDAFLVETHKAEYPWLPDVYKNLCGYVHFSASHITDSISNFEDASRNVEFEMSATDLKFPDFSWIEVVNCFRESTSILSWYLQGYAETKKLTPAEMDTLRSKN